MLNFISTNCYVHVKGISNNLLFIFLDSADFDISPQFITFPGDKDTLPVQVLLTDDKILEEKESFIVTLNVTGNAKEVIVGKPDSVMVTIEDNDGKYVNLFVCIACIESMYLCIHTRVCIFQ